MARGAGRAGRNHRGRGARGAAAASTRSGTSCSRPSRRGSCSCGSSGSMCGCRALRSGSGRTGSPGWCARWRAAGGRGVTRATVSADGETITVHIPHDVQEARRAETGGDAGRRGVGAAAAGRQRDGQGAGSGVPVAEACWTRAYTRRLEDLARAKASTRPMPASNPAADAARAGDGGGDPRWAAAGGAAAG